MSHRCLASVLTVIAVVALAAIPVAAQPAPRTPWGTPDLGGIWDFRSITPLQRPEELADQEFLTEEEAANLEQETVERNERLLHNPAQRTQAGNNVDRREGGGVGAYNNYWLDRGTTVVSSRRTSLIVDPPNGRIPPLTLAAEERAEARRAYRRDHPADSWEDRGLNDRCMFTTGLPIIPSAYNNNVHLLQTPDHVAMLIEMTHTLRIVPLNGRPHGALRQWVGESRGHWEGDTLVVETELVVGRSSARGRTGPNAHSNASWPDTLQEFTVEDPETARPWTAVSRCAVRGSDVRIRVPRRQLLHGGHPHWSTGRGAGGSRSRNGIKGTGPNAHLVERFTRVGPDTLQYEFTVEDPETFARPWTAVLPLTRSEDPMFEYACHEGNYSMEGILTGARAEEQAAAEAATGSR